MALFKILKGNSDNFNTDVSSESVSPAFNEGYCYFIKDNQKLYVDWLDGEERKRTALVGEKLVIELNEKTFSSDSTDTIAIYDIPNAKTLINEAIDKNIPIELKYYDIIKFNSLELFQRSGDFDMFLTNVVTSVILEQSIIMGILASNTQIWIVEDMIDQFAITTIGKKGKIAVYSDEMKIEGKDLWYSLHLISKNGVFECSNTEMDNFITNDNKDSIKITIEFDEENSIYTSEYMAPTLFKQKQAFQKANYTVSLSSTDGITITDSNNKDSSGNYIGPEWIKATLLVDNTVTQQFS